MEQSNNFPMLMDLIKTVVYLLPVLALIWKAARLTSKVDQNESRINKLTQVVREQDAGHDVLLSGIQNALNDIKVSIAKLETKIEDREKASK